MGKSADSSRSRDLVYDAVGAEAGDAAEDGGAGEAEFADFLHDRFVEGMAFEGVGFAVEDAEEHAVVVDGHGGAGLEFGEGSTGD